MLLPMVLAKPERGWLLALYTTIASTLGGVIGYFIGYFAIELVLPIIQDVGYIEAFQTSQEWFTKWGFLAVFLAGFTPIPYKVFTIAAGAATMSLPLFILASLVGRGARYFLVAATALWGGNKIAALEKHWMDKIGWLLVFTAVALYFTIQP